MAKQDEKIYRLVHELLPGCYSPERRMDDLKKAASGLAYRTGQTIVVVRGLAYGGPVIMEIEPPRFGK